MNTLKNKIDFAVIVTVDHANPNGDPLNGNIRCMHKKKNQKSSSGYG